MIPVAFLNVANGMRVLDMCAAPGSKTSQIAEGMAPEAGFPKGLLVANDADLKRCHLLSHQSLRRCQTPTVVVTCHEAQMFPTVYVRDPATGKRSRYLVTSTPSIDIDMISPSISTRMR